MLQIFRQNYFLNSLLLLPYSLILSIDSYVLSAPTAGFEASPFYNLLFGWIQDNSWMSVSLATFLIFIEAVMVNRLAIKHRLSRVTSLIPGVMYIIIMNALPEVRGMHPLIVANFFALLFLLNTFPIIRLYDTQKLLFNMGLWGILATFIYPAYGVLFGLSVISIQILRSFSLKEIGQVVAGSASIVIIVFTIFYARNEVSGFWQSFGAFKLSNLIAALNFKSVGEAILIVVLLGSVGLSLLNYYKLISKQSIREQKKIDLLYWFLAATFIGIILLPDLSIHSMLLAAIPLALFFGILLANWKMTLGAEIIHLLLVIGVLYLHFQ